MAKLTLNDVTSGYASTTLVNANNTLTETALENTLSRDGTGPNQMEANLDMNGNNVLNIGTLDITTLSADNLVINGELVTPSALAVSTLPDPTGHIAQFLQTDGINSSWQVPDSSEVSFTQFGTGAVARTAQAKMRDVVSVFDFMTTAQIADVQAGTALLDVTAAIQAAIDSVILAGTVYFPRGVYRISSTLTILGNTRNVKLVGDNGVTSIIPGGEHIESASVLAWYGANNGVMLTLESVEGTHIQYLNFQTQSTVYDDSVITITGVYGVRYINKSSCRFSTITGCEFQLLYCGIHYFDDASNPSSDTNMDGHAIKECTFQVCENGIIVDQSNVYDTEVFRCSFFGSTVYTKHHVWIKKGHLYLRSCYLGPLKDAASVGGKNGIAIYIQNGTCNVTDTYSEAHNGPFYVWESAFPAGWGSSIVGCNILNATASLPTTYNLLNSTAEYLTIVGGRIAGAVSQLAATAGGISAFGVRSFEVDSTSKPDAVALFGAIGSDSMSGLIGTHWTGTSGGGVATLNGYTPKLVIRDRSTTKTVEVAYASNILTFASPGYVNGPKFDYTNSILNLSDSIWSMKTDSVWDGSHIIMGSYHLWVDATGDLRIKSGAPASDLDGAVVGTQT